MIRAVRPLRLIRLVKAWNVTDFVLEHFRSEVAMISTYVLGILIILILLIHVIACIWYAAHGIVNDDSTTLQERYLISFHYVLALFVGEHIKLPQNLAERFTTIVILVLA